MLSDVSFKIQSHTNGHAHKAEENISPSFPNLTVIHAFKHPIMIEATNFPCGREHIYVQIPCNS
jgi:hypothetical protein